MRKAAQCFCEMKTSTRQARKTVCVSKLEKIHDIAIGLLINKVEFGRDIYAAAHVQPTTVFFHSVATKHLPHYLGWHRELSASKELSLERLRKTITDHWEHQPLMET